MINCKDLLRVDVENGGENTAQLRNRFHVSAAEIDEQDTHRIIVIGVAAIVPHNAMADSLMEEISLFVEENCGAEILDETPEIR